jgi:predicted DNA-binding transcriptional regulator YafY
MAKAPGRDQQAAMERLLRILLALSNRERGIAARRLAEIAGHATDENGLTKLRRDIRQLREDGGWDIESVGGEGESGRYLLHAHDNRMALLLTPGERAALQQAAMAVDVAVPEPSPQLAVLERAVERHCIARFSYRHKRRRVHPHTLHNGPSGWMLRGREVDSDLIKEFVVERISGAVSIDDPGSADVPDSIPRHSFDPLTWDVDPLEDVLVVIPAEHADEVASVLTGAVEHSRSGDQVILTVPVTHRAAFRSRIFELGGRVRLVGSSANRDELIMVLRSAAAEDI